ncbi:type II toxin-antitoxin system CcdA family antitoxin [Glaciecola sp. MF2-115]|uniref:type II toxin-antitoxin system CcdA family antitoxin n=1 Tax=Glaciecola sp. MF2-115 TaxID=3384827 RepID=UPI0039A1C83F
MSELYDYSAPKKATNLSINSDLLVKTREMKINLSATLEQALQEKLKVAKENAWKEENKMAINAYNQFVEENGSFSDEFGGI